MLTIGICDDDKVYRDNIREYCDRYFCANPLEYQCVDFCAGEEVLNYSEGKIHLLFLDIEMKGISGLELMEKLRDNEMVWRIAFVTSHEELKWDTIDLKTLAFLEKPVSAVGIEKCLKTTIRENRENIDISFRSLDGNINMKLDEIVYIQAIKNYVNIYSHKEELMGYDSMKKFEELLKGTTMLRIHKSYLVNMQHVKKLAGEEMLMTDGRKIPIGRKYYQEVKETYFAFLKAVTIERNKGA